MALPGLMMPLGLIAVAARITDLAVADSATSTSHTITVPASVQAGDLLVLSDFAFNTGTTSIPTNVVPSGFTQVQTASMASGNPDAFRLTVSYKIADGTEASTSITGMNSAFESKRLYVFRASAAISAASVASVNSQATAGNPSPQPITSSGGAVPLVVLAAYAADGTVNPRTMTPAKDGELGSGQHWLAYKIYNSSPADVSADMDDEGDANILISCYIAVS